MGKLTLLTFFLLATSVNAQHLIDASMRDLNYTRPTGNVGAAGTISFTRLELRQPSMNMTLDNGSRVFDSNISLNGKTVNLRGSNHRLRFSFTKDESLNLVDRAIMSNIAFHLEDEQLTQSSDRIYLKKDTDDIDISNYTLTCNKNSAYNMRDTETIMYGCMTDAVLTPKTGSQISLTVGYTHEKLGQIGVISKIKRASITPTRMAVSLGNTNMLVGGTLAVNIRDSLRFDCMKSSDVTLLNKDRLINDCKTDFMAHIANVNVNGMMEMGAANEETDVGLDIEGGFVGNGTSSMMFQAQRVSGSIGEKIISANKVSLRCNKDSGFSEITTDNIKRACTSNMELRTLDASRYSLFRMSDEIEGGRLDVQGLLNKFTVTNDKVQVTSARTIIDHPDMEIRMTGVSGYAAKNSGRIDVDNLDGVIKKALTNFKLERNDVVIKSKTESDSWKYIVIDKLEGKDGRIKLNIPALQTVTGDNMKTFYGLTVDCNRRQTDDLSVFGIARGCARSGVITLSHVIKTTGIDARVVKSWYPQLLTMNDTSGVIPSNMTLNDTQQVYQIRIDAAGGLVWIALEAKIAGIWKSVTLEGTMTVNESLKRLEIRRTTSNINETLLNFGIGQALPADFVTTSGPMIYIKLGN